jgi:hypothetical protein
MCDDFGRASTLLSVRMELRSSVRNEAFGRCSVKACFPFHVRARDTRADPSLRFVLSGIVAFE